MMQMLGMTNFHRWPRDNYDESIANRYPNLPDPLTLKNGQKVTTPEMWWKQRRPEIVEDYEREFYGRIPANVPGVKWTVTSVTNRVVSNQTTNFAVIEKRLAGHVDNSSYTNVSVDMQFSFTVPANAAGPVPLIIQLTAGGGGGFGRAAAFQDAELFLPAGCAGEVWSGAATNAAAARRRRRGGFGGLRRGRRIRRVWRLWRVWRPARLAGDGVEQWLGLRNVQHLYGASGRRGRVQPGIIGLVNKGQHRKLDDWGVLRAWAWGASRALDYLETDPLVDAKQVGLEGHSRWGKATIVAMAFDQRFAIAYSSSSGFGGAEINRRNYGEVLENGTWEDAYHWYAANLIKYAGLLTPGDLPVDGHELVALCAPRPVFIGGGNPTDPGGDGHADPKGMFMAAAGASPVYELLGKKGLGTTEFPPIGMALIDGDVAYREHAVDTPTDPTGQRS